MAGDIASSEGRVMTTRQPMARGVKGIAADRAGAVHDRAKGSSVGLIPGARLLCSPEGPPAYAEDIFEHKVRGAPCLPHKIAGFRLRYRLNVRTQTCIIPMGCAARADTWSMGKDVRRDGT